MFLIITVCSGVYVLRTITSFYATLEVLFRGLRRSSEQIVIFMFIQPRQIYSLIVSGLLAINKEIWGAI